MTRRSSRALPMRHTSAPSLRARQIRTLGVARHGASHAGNRRRTDNKRCHWTGAVSEVALPATDRSVLRREARPSRVRLRPGCCARPRPENRARPGSQSHRREPQAAPRASLRGGAGGSDAFARHRSHRASSVRFWRLFDWDVTRNTVVPTHDYHRTSSTIPDRTRKWKWVPRPIKSAICDRWHAPTPPPETLHSNAFARARSRLSGICRFAGGIESRTTAETQPTQQTQPFSRSPLEEG